MDPKVLSVVRQTLPKMNPTVTQGIAVKAMRQAVEYIHEIFLCAKQNFPPGLEYLGYDAMTPLEEYLEVTEPRNGKSYFDMSRSDMYMVKFIFQYHDEVIEKPLYIPFVREAGLINILGSTFSISPVLADQGLSMSNGSIFIQIPKDKLTFSAAWMHQFIVGDIKKKAKIVYSQIYRDNKKRTHHPGYRGEVQMKTTLPHYLFAKYGVHRTFAQLFQTQVVIGYPDTINEEQFPEDQWIICRSTKIKPVNLKSKVYQPTDICLAIRECDLHSTTEALIGNFFYIVDHFPERVQPEFIDGSPDELRLWRILLGIILNGLHISEGDLAHSMDRHIHSLDTHIDAKAKNELRQADIVIDDFYDLLCFIIERLTNKERDNLEKSASIYNKQLMVLRYVLKDINDNIFRAMYRLQDDASKKTLAAKDIKAILRKCLPHDEVFKINNTNRHSEVSSVSSPSDNMFFKITSNMVLQNNSGGSRKTKNVKIGKEQLLHVSIAEVGSYCVLPKSDPTGRQRINPWVATDEYDRIVRKKHLFELTQATQALLKRD